MEDNHSWTKESILRLIATSDDAVAAAITALHERQTEAEKNTGDAVERNGRGFNKRDADFLSSIAIRLPRYDNHMTPRQLEVARRKLPKYWRQLLEITKERQMSRLTGVKFSRVIIDEVDDLPSLEPADVVEPADITSDPEPRIRPFDGLLF